MGRRRWEGASDDDKAAHMRMMGEASRATLTPEERSASASKAAKARWAKRKASGKSAREKSIATPTCGA